MKLVSKVTSTNLPYTRRNLLMRKQRSRSRWDFVALVHDDDVLRWSRRNTKWNIVCTSCKQNNTFQHKLLMYGMPQAHSDVINAPWNSLFLCNGDMALFRFELDNKEVTRALFELLATTKDVESPLAFLLLLRFVRLLTSTKLTNYIYIAQTVQFFKKHLEVRTRHEERRRVIFISFRRTVEFVHTGKYEAISFNFLFDNSF